MSPSENPEGLLAATRELTTKVRELDRHLSVAQAQARRMKVLTFVSVFLAISSIVGVTVTIVLYDQVNEATTTNQQNAVTNCQNTNESRRANRTLWNFVVDLTLASRDRPEAERAQLEEIRAWIGELFAQRDCSRLADRLELPAPPPILPRT